jgi:hypothetical protein
VSCWWFKKDYTGIICWVSGSAVGLLLNLETAHQGRSVLLSDEQNLLLKETNKGFVENTKMDFMSTKLNLI